MTPAEIVKRERERALPVAVATFLGLALFFVAGNFGAVSATLLNPDAIDSEALMDFVDDRDDLLLGTILQSAGLLLMAVPLLYLFQAAAARSETMRGGLIGVTAAGPLFLALSGIFAFLALDSAASDFATPGGGAGQPVGEYVDDLLEDQSTYGIAQGLGFAGTFGLVVAIVYVSLHAMRVGLLSRFWGTLGMALGVSVLFLGILGILIYFLAMGLLIANRWPRGRPPAWERGEAVPWPAPGREPDAEAAEADDSDRPADPDEFAATIEGTGSEVEAADDPGAADDGPRKRKRR
jgi:hypothetical protein